MCWSCRYGTWRSFYKQTSTHGSFLSTLLSSLHKITDKQVNLREEKWGNSPRTILYNLLFYFPNTNGQFAKTLNFSCKTKALIAQQISLNTVCKMVLPRSSLCPSSLLSCVRGPLFVCLCYRNYLPFPPVFTIFSYFILSHCLHYNIFEVPWIGALHLAGIRVLSTPFPVRRLCGRPSIFLVSNKGYAVLGLCTLKAKNDNKQRQQKQVAWSFVGLYDQRL